MPSAKACVAGMSRSGSDREQPDEGAVRFRCRSASRSRMARRRLPSASARGEFEIGLVGRRAACRERRRRSPRPAAARGRAGGSASGWSAEAPGRMADDQEQRARRRLLEHLQERIGGARIHVVGGIDDRDPPAGLAAGRAEEGDGAADLVDGQLGPVALLVRRPRAARGQAGSGAPGAATWRNGGMIGRQREVARRLRPRAQRGSGWARTKRAKR